jgi:alpha-tubulin suppressor-like RCC1 family protein
MSIQGTLSAGQSWVALVFAAVGLLGGCSSSASSASVARGADSGASGADAGADSSVPPRVDASGADATKTDGSGSCVAAGAPCTSATDCCSQACGGISGATVCGTAETQDDASTDGSDETDGADATDTSDATDDAPNACANVQCNAPPSPAACYQATGTCFEGTGCSYAFVNGGSCVASDPCVAAATCSFGGCGGLAITCNAPPASRCISSTTLRTYAASGMCGAGTCMYASTDTACPDRCAAGACTTVTSPPTASAVSTGGEFTCAVTTGGAVQCWGDNYWGELGSGSTTDASTPTGVTGLGSGVIALSTGQAHACAITHAGAVMCWGDNTVGEITNNATMSAPPTAIAGFTAAVQSIAEGPDFMCALTAGGGVACWGADDYGQLGDGSPSGNSGGNEPSPVKNLASGAIAITLASAGEYACALMTGGTVQCWGDGYGAVPVVVGGLSGIVAVAAGIDFACALTSGGGVKCWGANFYGQLGNDSTMTSTLPVDVVGLSSGVVAISAGNEFACAVTAGGGVACWGENTYGQLGASWNGGTSGVPVNVTGLASGIVSIAAGGLHTCALTNVGDIVCWGDDMSGQLGNSSTTSTVVPVGVVGL